MSAHSIHTDVISFAARLSAAAAISFSLAGMPGASAQTGPESLGTMPETVVTATRIPTPPAEVASTIRVVTAEEIERNQYRSVFEALRTLPGLNVVRSGGPGKATTIFSRGTNGNQTLVMIDGIEINDPSSPSGAADLGNLTVQDVERIEVLYGSQGTLYGSDAIGAVVNIITRRGEGPPSVAATAEGGSFETFNQFASLRGATERFRYALNAEHFRVGGLSATAPRLAPPGEENDDDEYENYTVSTNLGFAPSDAVDFSFSGRFTDAETETDASTSLPQSDNDFRAETEQAFLRGDARVKLFDGKTAHRLGVAYTRYDREDRNDPDPINPADFLRDSNEGTRLKIDLQNDLRLIDGHITTLGLETEEETIDLQLTSTSLFGPFEQSADADVRNNAVYLQDQFSYARRFFGTVGVRLDDHETFGTETTWRIAPAYLHLETGTKLRASYATGFKAPTLSQLFGSSVSVVGPFLPNPDLRPEESRTWEVGIEQRLFGDRLEMGATWFDTEVKNLIQANAAFTTNENIGRAELYGAEAFIRARPADDVTVTLNYSYTVAEDKDTGQDLLRRPRHKASFDVGYRPIPGLVLSAAGVFVGSRSDIEAVTFARIRQEGYFVVNVAASYEVTGNLRIFGRVENLLDRDYEDPNGFEQPGIGGFGGLTLRF